MNNAEVLIEETVRSVNVRYYISVEAVNVMKDAKGLIYMIDF